ncbi:MAG: hypothetical protein WC649_09545 [Desulfobacteria bacterium]
MKHLLPIVIVGAIAVAGLSRPAIAHSVHYQVENRGISVRVFYTQDNLASYSQYEILGPGDKIPHQKGRTDKNGVVSFLPDRPGKWLIKVSDESEHGIHGVQIKVQVNKSLLMESFKKPLVAMYTKLFVGLGFIMGIFGLWTLLKGKR